jgi:hypothetical protein
MVALRAAAADAGVPAGESDRFDIDEWIPHLSLAYARDVDPARWEELRAWVRGVDVGSCECVAVRAELVAYDGGPERRSGTFALAGGR